MKRKGRRRREKKTTKTIRVKQKAKTIKKKNQRKAKMDTELVCLTRIYYDSIRIEIIQKA